LVIKRREIKINIKMNGRRTKNHEIAGAPARHIKLRTQVQNKMKIALIKKIKTVLETVQV
jgi:hypothetical protein